MNKLIAMAVSSFLASAALAQTPSATEWKYRTPRLDRVAVDALLATPQKLVVIDVRRPDEVGAKGSFPVYLSIQATDVEKNTAWIPRDRVILTVSNHAHRAGAAGDVLASKGFKVAGATGSEDYEAEGGKAVVRVVPPARPASAP